MAKKKSQSKLGKVVNWIKPTSVGKGMLLYAIVFAVVGGSYMVYRSFAATTQPPITYGITKLVNFKTTDGVLSNNNQRLTNHPQAGDVEGRCMRYTAQSSYGSFTLCVQRKWTSATASNIREVLHNFVTGQYTRYTSWVPAHDWTPYNPAEGDTTPYWPCDNTHYLFAELGEAANTDPTTDQDYGLTSYGQQYRQTSNSKWQIDLTTNVNKLKADGTSPSVCDIPDVWYNIIGTW